MRGVACIFGNVVLHEGVRVDREIVRSTTRHVLVPGEFRKDATTAREREGGGGEGREGVERGWWWLRRRLLPGGILQI